MMIFLVKSGNILPERLEGGGVLNGLINTGKTFCGDLFCQVDISFDLQNY